MRKFRFGKKQSWVSLIATVLAILFVYAQQQGWLGGAGQTLESNQPGLYTVKRFSDGDTITVSMNGRDEKVRMVGVDTPETHKPNAPVQCYGPAASAFTKNTIGKQKVRLVADAQSTDRDRYKRLLRYVYLEDGTFLNLKLIENGYGFYYPYFPFTKSDEFAAAQEKARATHKGLWGNCTPTPTDRGGWVSNDI